MTDISANRASDKSQQINAFRLLCEARARAYAEGRLGVIDAVDRLQDWAFTRGLIDAIGQDAVQAIMADAFRPYREG